LRELDILARVGGDEFIVLVDDFDDPLQLGEIAQKLLTEARKPFIIDGQEAMLSASIGIATYPGDGDNAQTLIKNADIAMYRA
ncbi:diguanylate cyclase domain-containing protein, partial [Salmonella enterica]